MITDKFVRAAGKTFESKAMARYEAWVEVGGHQFHVLESMLRACTTQFVMDTSHLLSDIEQTRIVHSVFNNILDHALDRLRGSHYLYEPIYLTQA